MREFQFGEAQRHLHDFLWGELCDWYIEIAKIRLNDAEVSPVSVLIHVLEKSLRLLHPFMPFITEELWQHLRPYLPGGEQPESIMIAPYPRADETAIDAGAERVMTAVTDIIRAVRNARAENNVPAGRRIEAKVYAGKLAEDIAAHKPAINTLAGANIEVAGRRQAEAAADAVVMVLADAEVEIPLASMVDIQAEKQRLSKEIQQAQAEVRRLEAMLGNEEFLAKAPPAVVDKERARLASRKDNLERLSEHLQRLND
jgi:valyl-tRNA synthetase